MSLVAILSPCAGETDKQVEIHREYALAAMMDSIRRGETPIVPHLLYTQVLDDRKESERTLGMNLGSQWFTVIDYAVVYTDYDISDGMSKEVDQLTALGVKFITREIGK